MKRIACALASMISLGLALTIIGCCVWIEWAGRDRHADIVWIPAFFLAALFILIFYRSMSWLIDRSFKLETDPAKPIVRPLPPTL